MTDVLDLLLNPAANGRADVFAEESVSTFVECFSVADLLNEELPDIEFIVPGIIPTGCTLVAGKPKSGKTYWALNVSYAVAIGGYAFGKVRVDGGRVLYLALEGTRRDLHRRFTALIDGAEIPQALVLAKEWPTGLEGVERLEHYAQVHTDLRLVVVDTIKNLRDYSGGGYGKTAYDFDYEALKPYTDLSERCGFSIVALHHNNKTQGLDDPFDAISGSTGLRGAVDTEAVLLRDATSAALRMLARGRQLEAVDLTFEFDTRLMTWVLVSSTDNLEKTTERQVIADILLEAHPQRFLPKTIYEKLVAQGYKRSESNVRHLLRKMVQEPDSQIIGDGTQGYGVNPLVGGCSVHSIHNIHVNDHPTVNE